MFIDSSKSIPTITLEKLYKGYISEDTQNIPVSFNTTDTNEVYY